MKLSRSGARYFANQLAHKGFGQQDSMAMEREICNETIYFYLAPNGIASTAAVSKFLKDLRKSKTKMAEIDAVVRFAKSGVKEN